MINCSVHLARQLPRILAMGKRGAKASELTERRSVAPTSSAAQRAGAPARPTTAPLLHSSPDHGAHALRLARLHAERATCRKGHMRKAHPASAGWAFST